MVAPANKRVLLESDKAAANGLATLGADSKLPDVQAPTTMIKKWQPATDYTGGQQVITPAGEIVAAKATFTSGATFDRSNWDYFAVSRLFFDVRNHGAKCDGVTDDQPAIQALINQIDADPTIAGAYISFPAGTTAVANCLDLPRTTNWSNTFMAKPIRLIGAGRNVTKLKAIGAAASFDAVIRHQPPTPLVTGGASHEIAHMTIDSNKVAKRNIDLVNAHAVHVHNIYGLNPALGGGYSNLRITGQGTDYLSWENVIGPMVRLEGGGGSDQTQWSDYNLEVLSTDNHILSSVILVRGKIANGVDNGGNNFWTGVHTFYGPVGFWQKGTFGSFYDHCEADGPDQIGFKVEANNTKIHGSHIFWPTGTYPTGAIGIQLVYPITGASITGNTIPDAPADKKIVSLTRVDVTTTITGNPGAAIDTGPNPQGTNFSVQYGDALTTANGNARGVGAADLQFIRNSAAQVASGAQSFTAGYGNTASGFASVALGSLNTSNGSTSFASGARATTRQTNSKKVHAAGRFAVDGDQQVAEHIVSAVTTSTTKTQLTIGNAGVSFNNVVALPGSISAYLATIKLVGQKTGGAAGEAGYWTITALFRRLASGSSTIVKLANPTAPTWTAGQGDPLALTAVPDLTAETLYGHIGVHITAPDAGTWHWVAKIDTVEVA
jgi:hypothetical protein